MKGSVGNQGVEGGRCRGEDLARRKEVSWSSSSETTLVLLRCGWKILYSTKICWKLEGSVIGTRVKGEKYRGRMRKRAQDIMVFGSHRRRAEGSFKAMGMNNA